MLQSADGNTHSGISERHSQRVKPKERLRCGFLLCIGIVGRRGDGKWARTGCRGMCLEPRN